jgi:phage shock protein C
MSKRFYRSRDRVFGGVLAGFAEQINSDKKLVRIIYVLISILSAGFPGTLVYLILWAITPEKPLDI